MQRPLNLTGLLLAALAVACAGTVPARVGGTTAPSSSPSAAAAASPAAPSAACQHDVPSRCDAAHAPTYERDVRPIIERRCARCHTGDGEAAEDHDFSRVETLRAQRVGLTEQVHACVMPPRTEEPLPSDEAQTLLAWVVCGAK